MQISGIERNARQHYVNANLQRKDEEQDPLAENLRGQISALREKLQALSDDTETDAKTRSELQKEIRKQMNELEQQLRQRQIEARREKKTEKEDSSPEKTAPLRRDTYTQGGLDSALSASSLLELSRIRQSAAEKKENAADILEREAETDTKTVSKVIIAGHERVNRVLPPKDGDGEKAAEISEETAENSDSPKEIPITRIVFEKVYETRRGAAVEEKENAAAILRGEALNVKHDRDRSLSEAYETAETGEKTENAEAEK